jgi:ABC-type Fe3+-hydroxamate transport system substrate-binding protein
MPGVVSLVPSLTELAVWLGAGDRLIGRTRFCTEPGDALLDVPALGGTKDPDIGAIVDAGPSLVLANKEENRREDIEALRAAGLTVLLTEPNTVLEAASMVETIGKVLECAEGAAGLAAEIRAEAASGPQGASPRVFVAVWWRPLMGLGSDTFGSDVLRAAGAANVLEGRPRYPRVTLDEVREARPDIIVLPDEPFRFQQRHVPPFAGIAPSHLVDGKLLWWYGPRLPESIRRLRALLGRATSGR